jgi:Holliday junction resolvase RusA-like endonuclease
VLEFEFKGNPIAATRPRVGKHGTYNVGDYAKYKEDLSFAISATALRHSWHLSDKLPITGKLALRVRYYRSDKRRVDIDNLVKCTMDALQQSGLIQNDSDIQELHAMKLYDKENPRVWFELMRKEG